MNCTNTWGSTEHKVRRKELSINLPLILLLLLVSLLLLLLTYFKAINVCDNRDV